MKLLYKLILVTNFSLFATAFMSNPVFLDVDEMNLVQYDVKIGDQPIVLDDNEHPNIPSDEHNDVLFMPMMNKYGQKYHCLVPKPEEAKDLTDSDKEDGVEDKKEEIVQLTGVAKARKLLEPMASQPCLFKTKDWWTYEFCYGRNVRQFHMEDGKPSGAIMILGFYDHDKEFEDEESKSEDPPLPRLRHHTQIYLNGSQCDLTGGLRRTEVRFVCDPTSVVDVLSQIDEPQSCEYILTITTSKICAIPELRPPPAKKPLKIECQPVLTAQEYEKYERHLKNKEKSAIKKAEEMKMKRKESLLKVLEGESIDNIDINSDEGMTVIEGMVGEKLAERLVGELGAILGSSGKSKSKWITPSTGGDPIEVEEVKMKSGEMQTKIITKKANEFHNLLKGLKEPAPPTPTKTTKNLDPRSDLSDEDEMIEELVKTVKNMNQQGKETLGDLKPSMQKEIENSVDDIIEETEGEMNVKLDGVERSNAIQELHNTLQDLMSKLDKAEADIGKVNKEIETLHNTIDDKEEILDTLKKDEDVVTDEFEDIPSEESDKPIAKDDKAASDSKVNIKVTNFSPTTGLEDTASEKRVVKHLERAIKDKLTKAGLDTGGRQIEVKFISTTLPTDVFGGDSSNKNDEDLSNDEAKQFQSMIYNLMFGNVEAYEDIDNQRKTERSYHFALNDMEDTTVAEESSEPEEELELEQE